MWEWSRSVAERATATAWTRSAGEPAPTVVDPEVWAEQSGRPEEAGEPASDAVMAFGGVDGLVRSVHLPEYDLAR
ncbi:hypothetical protein B7C42_02388 [Nocardia cerradoensis]|uniref:Uncharacterized protein n=1 Tax=Nocardia cerradoensis TaxID=85688 RepID=A0A231H8B6_9NOCA|nr:hypothetical protein [Nocardia cerradoensis]OXR45263.1 hypothetical protein B7C42_02388 [Nocardia cerradoensis]